MLVWSIVVVFGMYFSSLSREPHRRHTDICHRSRLSLWMAWISSIRRHNTSRLSCWSGEISSTWRSTLRCMATRIASPYLMLSGVSFRRLVRTGAIGYDNSWYCSALAFVLSIATCYYQLPLATTETENGDRKSTRLNSSHL